MDFNSASLSPRDCYKLLVSVVVPRPIALVTSVDASGIVNAAPFSFFNAMGADPPLVVLGVGNRSREEPKDTAKNIRAGGEFVVNIVSEAIAERMNITAVDFPHGTDELAAAGLASAPSHRVKPPRVAESPVNMECREVATTEIGRNRIILGEVLVMHVRDDCVDPAKFYVFTEKLHAVGRMHAPGWYCRTDDQFVMERMTHAEWLKTSKP